MSGAGSPCPWGRPGGIGGAPPPGLFGIAGAGRPEAGGGGGAREPPSEPIITIITILCSHFIDVTVYR